VAAIVISGEFPDIIPLDTRRILATEGLPAPGEVNEGGEREKRES